MFKQLTWLLQFVFLVFLHFLITFTSCCLTWILLIRWVMALLMNFSCFFIPYSLDRSSVFSELSLLFFLFSFWLPQAISCLVQIRSHTAGHLQQLPSGSIDENKWLKHLCNELTEKMPPEYQVDLFCVKEKFLELYVRYFGAVYFYLLICFKLYIVK